MLGTLKITHLSYELTRIANRSPLNMNMSVTPATVALAGVAAASVVLCFSLVRVLVRPLFSPLRHVPGPPGGSLLLGHADAFWEPRKESVIEEWIAKYGHILKFKDFLNVSVSRNYIPPTITSLTTFGCRTQSDHLLILDTRAIQHVLSSAADDYVRPPEIIFLLQDFLGVGKWRYGRISISRDE